MHELIQAHLAHGGSSRGALQLSLNQTCQPSKTIQKMPVDGRSIPCLNLRKNDIPFEALSVQMHPQTQMPTYIEMSLCIQTLAHIRISTSHPSWRPGPGLAGGPRRGGSRADTGQHPSSSSRRRRRPSAAVRRSLRRCACP